MLHHPMFIDDRAIIHSMDRVYPPSFIYVSYSPNGELTDESLRSIFKTIIQTPYVISKPIDNNNFNKKRKFQDTSFHPSNTSSSHQQGSTTISREVDVIRISNRRKQLDHGKNTLGYDRFRFLIPRSVNGDHRDHSPSSAVTPDPLAEWSKRGWDEALRHWRRDLHSFDLDRKCALNPRSGRLVLHQIDRDVDEQELPVSIERVESTKYLRALDWPVESIDMQKALYGSCNRLLIGSPTFLTEPPAAALNPQKQRIHNPFSLESRFEFSRSPIRATYREAPLKNIPSTYGQGMLANDGREIIVEDFWDWYHGRSGNK
jgi:Histone RNA hairpin-binding protein RNA-binding domain